MSDIPADIMDTAIHEATFFVEWLQAGNSTGSLSPHAQDGLADSIARAILAERERCANIAAKFFGGRAHTYASENADLYIAQDTTWAAIAKAIRGEA